LSTTVALETLSYLENLIKQRQAYALAEAVDLLVERLRKQENRERLEQATAALLRPVISGRGRRIEAGSCPFEERLGNRL
jgi:hypothetical protein